MIIWGMNYKMENVPWLETTDRVVPVLFWLGDNILKFLLVLPELRGSMSLKQ